MSLAMSSSPSNMAAWETEDEMSAPAIPILITPRDVRTPSRSSRTPSRSSKRSRRSVTPPARISASPPPMPGSDKTDKSDKVMRDITMDENISILDPRRFTPTLHANLVSEILSLRRDQEEKLKSIESLEAALQSTREGGDSVHATLQNTAKENRSLKRQLALLEGGTSSALGELARERDEAIEAAADAKRRLESVQKKLKTEEESSARAHEQWINDKDDWEEERRKMERKLHVMESRLKIVLEEVAAFQMSQANGHVEGEDDAEEKCRDSDAGSIRSMTFRDSLRFSLMNNKANGVSLADELDFDDDSDYQTDTNGRESVMSNQRHMRTDSRASIMSKTHRRHHSGESLVRPGSVARGRFQNHIHKEGILANGVIEEDEEVQPPPPPKPIYKDTGIQFSPPPSPKLPPTRTSTVEMTGVSAMAAKWERHRNELETTEANQRRKRISIAKPLSIQTPPSQQIQQKLMVSVAAQTTDMPLSPPKTPRTPVQEQPPTPKKQPASMTSAGTQTDNSPSTRPITPPNAALSVPSIAIHPPTSLPPSPKPSRLPQFLKDFGCQVSISSFPTTSTGVQTEEIRIDQRLDKLPAHLHPSAITSRPATPATESQAQTDTDRTFTPVPARNPKRLTRSITSSPRASIDVEDKEANDLIASKAATRKLPHLSDAFSAFQDVSSADEMDDFADGDLSDSEYRTALSAPRAIKSPEPGRSTPGSVPTSPELAIPRKASGGRGAVTAFADTETYTSFKLSDTRGVILDRKSSMNAELRPSAMASSKSSAIRKSAMIQNGISAHQEDTADPPFPIPKRASSRQPLFGSSMPNNDNRSPTRNEPWHRKGIRNTHYRANSVRKSRSAAAVPYGKNKNRRRNSKSPSYSPDVPATPTLPPLPSSAKELSTPRNGRARGRGHAHQHSATTATTENTANQSSTSSQANNVVDSIAQSMVGEWMFKYVRRRKSFGMAGDNGRDDTSNDRHKRWVWLAPYERSILWSSKQPSSGSALLGKSGRKLAIQSVLDVKDDNPPPKGPTPVFNRSILILTPQRALKFTTTSADRHYLWLTALSFLAHSQQDVPDIPAVVPKHPPEYELPHLSDQARARRPRIRDSIRLAKGQNPVRDRMNDTYVGTGHTMSSQGLRDHSISPMPSIPDVPPTVGSECRSPPMAAASESAISGNSYPANPSRNQRELPSRDAAEPPQVPRFQDRGRPLPSFHGRKRSSTGGRVPPPLSFRGFAAPMPAYYHAPTNSQSTGAGSSDIYMTGPKTSDATHGGWGGSAMSTVSTRTSETSNRTSNMFEAIGTMRMEAFISPLAYSRYDSDGQTHYADAMEEQRYRARRRSKEIRRQRSRSRQRDRDSFSRGRQSAWAREEYYGGHRTAGEEEYGISRRSSRRDPFEGF